MIIKKFWLGMLMFALVLGMTVIGCEEEEDPPPPQPGDTMDNPINRVESIDLGDMTSENSGWKQLLNSIESTKKYVNLDLSKCTMIGTKFDPDFTFREGKAHIVSLILPNAAKEIASGGSDNNYSERAFRSFVGLTHIRGTNIEKIGENILFYSRMRIADFPNVKTIGSSVFWSSLTITMGATAPYLSKDVFYGSDYTVTVKVPSGASGYTPFDGTPVTVSGNNRDGNWANGLRGGGWTGTSLTDAASIKSNISITIEQQ